MAVVCVAGAVIAITGAMLIRRPLENWRQATIEASHGNYMAWQPDIALLPRLGDFKRVDRFELRLPKSFTALSVLPEPGWLPRNGHFVGLRWTGPASERAEMYSTVVTFPAATPMKGGLEDALDRFYEWLGYRAGLAELSRGEPELGLLNGRNGIRASFFCRLRRRETLRGVKREGIVYILLDGDRQVTLYTLCDPELQDDHNLMAASLLTWQEQ